VLPGRENVPAERVEMARVDAELLDTMLNNAGEVSIFRARLDQQVNSIDFNLAELARTVTRLKEQLRGLEIETEAQVLNRHQDEEDRAARFRSARARPLFRAAAVLARARRDLGRRREHSRAARDLTREAQNLLTQQARVITELQNSLMRTRMVPFQRHVQRLTRLVRQAANDTGKRAELVVQGAAAELDRQMLERMVPPLEHMLRNAVVHGIEPPSGVGARQAGRGAHLGQPERDGAEVVIVVTDDGAGINVKLIREKADRAGACRSAGQAHRRRGDAAHPGARLQHRGPGHAGGRPRRRHGRGRHRGQEARRRPVHRIDRRARARASRFACRSRSPSARP
jgi:chemosensory pili system protein ChpA (sensor histidine kinase/response regulator)